MQEERDAALLLPIARGVARQTADFCDFSDTAEAESIAYVALADAMRTFDPRRGDLTRRVTYLVRRRVLDFIAAQRNRREVVTPPTRSVDESGVLHRGLADLAQAEETSLEESVTRRLLVAEAVGRLPERDQRLLHAIYVLGASAEEASEALGVSAAVVRKAHERALKRIRADLGPHLEGEAL